ncbi:MAG TPA: RNA polymerase sporulation sigma factor SigH [Acidimicrobiales bacterium]|nr:RNA polymerase sporulation sigma factor SigH [Acidimicrobiales bacterium]
MAFVVQCVPLQDLSDVQLVERFHSGDEEAVRVLVVRYRRLVWAKARGYFLVGADFDDLEQEGMIGLFKAARDFQADRQVSFRSFADVCINRQMITAIKTATRRKHQPLNWYEPIIGPAAEEEAERRAEDILADEAGLADPVDAVIAGEQLAGIRARLGQVLSGLEVEVLRLYVEGRSYEEISRQLNRHVKSVDNALQRIKRKFGGQLDEQRQVPALAVA